MGSQSNRLAGLMLVGIFGLVTLAHAQEQEAPATGAAPEATPAKHESLTRRIEKSRKSGGGLPASSASSDAKRSGDDYPKYLEFERAHGTRLNANQAARLESYSEGRDRLEQYLLGVKADGTISKRQSAMLNVLERGGGIAEAYLMSERASGTKLTVGQETQLKILQSGGSETYAYLESEKVQGHPLTEEQSTMLDVFEHGGSQRTALTAYRQQRKEKISKEDIIDLRRFLKVPPREIGDTQSSETQK